MAHHIRVLERPHINKDGSESKTKKDYVIIERSRRGRREVETVNSKKRVEEVVDALREEVVKQHLAHHPRDTHFQRKHGVKP